VALASTAGPAFSRAVKTWLPPAEQACQFLDVFRRLFSPAIFSAQIQRWILVRTIPASTLRKAAMTNAGFGEANTNFLINGTSSVRQKSGRLKIFCPASQPGPFVRIEILGWRPRSIFPRLRSGASLSNVVARAVEALRPLRYSLGFEEAQNHSFARG